MTQPLLAAWTRMAATVSGDNRVPNRGVPVRSEKQWAGATAEQAGVVGAVAGGHGQVAVTAFAVVA